MEKELTFQPIGKRVVVTRKKPDVGGLSMPKHLERGAHPDIGEVIMVGNIGFWNKYVRGIRPGALICFTRFSPVAIRDEDLEHLFVDIENVLGVKK